MGCFWGNILFCFCTFSSFQHVNCDVCTFCSFFLRCSFQPACVKAFHPPCNYSPLCHLFFATLPPNSTHSNCIFGVQSRHGPTFDRAAKPSKQPILNLAAWNFPRPFQKMLKKSTSQDPLFPDPPTIGPLKLYPATEPNDPCDRARRGRRVFLSLFHGKEQSLPWGTPPLWPNVLRHKLIHAPGTCLAGRNPFGPGSPSWGSPSVAASLNNNRLTGPSSKKRTVKQHLSASKKKCILGNNSPRLTSHPKGPLKEQTDAMPHLTVGLIWALLVRFWPHFGQKHKFQKYLENRANPL